MKKNTPAITELLGKKLLIFDGATGTVLQGMGLSPGEPSDAWNLSRPDDIYKLHRSYLDAGCDIIKTNTFVSARPGNDDAARIAEAGCRIARAAVTDAGHGYVALDLGSTGHLFAPLGDLEYEDAIELYANVIRVGAPYCDCVLIETMTDVYEAKAAIIAAKESCTLPIFVSFTVNEGRLLSGADIITFATVTEALGVSAIGLNCGVGPDAMEKTLPDLLASTTLPVIVSPNAGLPVVDGNRIYYNVSISEYAEHHLRMAHMGAAALGGCCGTSPDYIKATAALVAGMDVVVRDFVPPPTRAASSSRTVTFGASPVVIGERINPTGKPKLKAALQRSDMDYILSLAYSQTDAGADALDINCGVPETDEKRTLVRVIRDVQSAVPLPLVIDTSDASAMEAAMRVCAGKPVVNSVNGKRCVMDAVFPLVKKYGGVVIGLTLDEGGIPKTADERFGIARRIVETAESYGISRRDILIDALTLTVAADPDAAKVTLDTVERVTKELQVGTVLGVSNVSFGFPDRASARVATLGASQGVPERDSVNAAFLTLALSRGLTAAIMNPESAAMQGAISAYRILCGGSPEASKASAEKSYTLAEAVFRGHKAEAAALVAEAVARGEGAVDIIDNEIIPGLSRLGDEYERNRVFLPQLMAGGDAASAAFGEIKKLLGGVPADKGTFVIATVEGDVHDIGKNIVSAIMSNYGYDVHDLGRDVIPERVVAEVKATGAKLVGLSALMTTTVPAMRRTIEALRADCDCKIVVGGAVLTEELARELGADYYSHDAMTNVKIAEEVYG